MASTWQTRNKMFTVSRSISQSPHIRFESELIIFVLSIVRWTSREIDGNRFRFNPKPSAEAPNNSISTASGLKRVEMKRLNCVISSRSNFAEDFYEVSDFRPSSLGWRKTSIEIQDLFGIPNLRKVFLFNKFRSHKFQIRSLRSWSLFSSKLFWSTRVLSSSIVTKLSDVTRSSISSIVRCSKKSKPICDANSNQFAFLRCSAVVINLSTFHTLFSAIWNSTIFQCDVALN